MTENGHVQYTAASKSSALEPTARTLASLADIFKKDQKLASILSAPTLSATDKSQIIVELQQQAGGAAAEKGELVKNLLKTLADNNRLGILQSICEKFGQLMGAARGEVDLIITSAAVRRHTV